MLKIEDNGNMHINASTEDMMQYLYIIFNAIENKYEEIKLKKLLLDYAKADKKKKKRIIDNAYKHCALKSLFKNKDSIEDLFKEILKK